MKNYILKNFPNIEAARFQTIEQALATSPMFYADLVESIGSQDGRCRCS